METSVELPTKREYDSDSGDEVAASKKVKAVVMEEESSEEEISEEETSDDEIMSEGEGEENMNIELDSLAMKTNTDIVREYQIFLQLKGHYDRANKIFSEMDAYKLLTTHEKGIFLDIFWEKWWHIRPNPAGFKLTDYQRLAIYPSEIHRYYSYSHYYFTYEFDCAYPKFLEELFDNIKWDTTMTEAWPIAKTILKKHLPADVHARLLDDDVHLGLIHECISSAIYKSSREQSAKEFSSLFLDLYKREVDGEDLVQALKEIVKEKRLESYAFNKAAIEEAFDNHEGRLWSTYRSMKRSYNFQKGEALDDNRLNDGITRFFEDFLEGSSQDTYTEYVEKKISIALELRILLV